MNVENGSHAFMSDHEVDNRRTDAHRRDEFVAGRRRGDVDIRVVYEDLKEVREELKSISQTIHRFAVQDEKIASAVVRMEGFETRLTDLANRHVMLRQSHDSCDIGKLLTEIRWMKWIVMATPAFYTFIFGTLLHFMIRPGG